MSTHPRKEIAKMACIKVIDHRQQCLTCTQFTMHPPRPLVMASIWLSYLCPGVGLFDTEEGGPEFFHFVRRGEENFFNVRKGGPVFFTMVKGGTRRWLVTNRCPPPREK